MMNIDLRDPVDAALNEGRIALNKYEAYLDRINDLERLELFLSAVLLDGSDKELTPEQEKLTVAFRDDSFDPPETIVDLLAIIDKALQ